MLQYRAAWRSIEKETHRGEKLKMFSCCETERIGRKPGEAAHEVVPGYAFDTPGVSASLIPEVLLGQCILSSLCHLSLFMVRNGRNPGDAALKGSETHCLIFWSILFPVLLIMASSRAREDRSNCGLEAEGINQITMYHV